MGLFLADNLCVRSRDAILGIPGGTRPAPVGRPADNLCAALLDSWTTNASDLASHQQPQSILIDLSKAVNVIGLRDSICVRL